jgi:phytanoyl-CoA hydroxylase
MRTITDNEIAFFEENGYVLCRGVVAADELDLFRSETARLLTEIQAGGPAAGMCRNGPEGIPYYLEYLHAHPNDFSLRLLAHPFIGDLLARMVGPDFVPCYESLVFKLPGGGSSVPWHRDGNSQSGNEPIFNIDIYPDRSTVENSCVWVVPGSHKWEHARAWEMAARGREQFELPGAVPAEMEPGDVLLHHVKVLHGSPVNRSDELRRVVYFDNRRPAWNDRYAWFHPDVMRRRALLYQYALHLRRAHPYPSDDATFDYQVPESFPRWEPGMEIDLHCPRDPFPNEPQPAGD